MSGGPARAAGPAIGRHGGGMKPAAFLVPALLALSGLVLGAEPAALRGLAGAWKDGGGATVHVVADGAGQLAIRLGDTLVARQAEGRLREPARAAAGPVGFAATTAGAAYMRQQAGGWAQATRDGFLLWCAEPECRIEAGRPDGMRAWRPEGRPWPAFTCSGGAYRFRFTRDGRLAGQVSAPDQAGEPAPSCELALTDALYCPGCRAIDSRIELRVTERCAPGASASGQALPPAGSELTLVVATGTYLTEIQRATLAVPGRDDRQALTCMPIGG